LPAPGRQDARRGGDKIPRKPSASGALTSDELQAMTRVRPGGRVACIVHYDPRLVSKEESHNLASILSRCRSCGLFRLLGLFGQVVVAVGSRGKRKGKAGFKEKKNVRHSAGDETRLYR
jgi:hypothetical protein